ncbi:bifunctional folylpolyglutamate synthase/dihydrofolate synthase [Paenibacillus pasadenensis]|uniref:bifunctional folylpolyglutamate synthase/dihydrofolate synthase n=1 Tax=Paenibacillus pasadenensis TaxID=217090 RepID=UPI00203FC79A|nr:folylpolyglutamate synthase/dihydrofolate synthase family protein [Paenibacillus pasadenensis]MCM3746721.1 bifunctional folylpolyglutamate synthase/dihydrofolate synthase [Paenibacillus pasadenensis]
MNDDNVKGESGSAAVLSTYGEARDWIEGLINFGIRPGLDRIRLLMERLGNPERRLRFIHVAGTNGKGSVCAYLTETLIRGGYDTGTFTSPYITKFTNRFRYNGQDIEEETLLRLANELKPHVEEIAATEHGSPTMFEVSTALAILFFAKVTYPDYVVWETGLGGRLDVTNIVTPVMSIITNVGHDHMDVLGDSIAAVAREKAGIIKPGVPVVSTVENAEALEIIRETARASKSTLYQLGEQFSETRIEATETEQSFRFQGPFRAIDSLALGLGGAHQRKNAAAAVMALEVLRQYNALLVEDEQLRAGLRLAQWPGRLEMVRTEPRLLLDGAHNPEGAASLAAALRDTYSYDRLHLMMGMLDNKNHRDVLRHILPIVDTFVVTQPAFRKAMPAAALAELAREEANALGVSPEIIVEPDWTQALRRLEQAAAPGDLPVVTGTLYLIADVRANVLGLPDSEKGW